MPRMMTRFVLHGDRSQRRLELHSSNSAMVVMQQETHTWGFARLRPAMAGRTQVESTRRDYYRENMTHAGLYKVL